MRGKQSFPLIHRRAKIFFHTADEELTVHGVNGDNNKKGL